MPLCPIKDHTKKFHGDVKVQLVKRYTMNSKKDVVA